MSSSPFSSRRLASLAGLVAFALTSPSLAQHGALSIHPLNQSLRSGESTPVVVRARFDPVHHAFASSAFRVHADEASWTSASAGALAGNQVQGISVRKSHQPWLGIFVSSANPLEVWRGRYRPTVRGPRLVEMGAYPTDFEVYPSPWTGSSAPCPAEAGKSWVLVDPLPIGRGSIAASARSEVVVVGSKIKEVVRNSSAPIVFGMLLPAVQQAREAARWSFSGVPDRLSIEVRSRSDAVPSEELHLNWEKIRPSYVEMQVEELRGRPVEVRLFRGQRAVGHFAFGYGAVRMRLDSLPDSLDMRWETDPESGRSQRVYRARFSGGVRVASSSSLTPVTADRVEIGLPTMAEYLSALNPAPPSTALRFEVEGIPRVRVELP